MFNRLSRVLFSLEKSSAFFIFERRDSHELRSVCLVRQIQYRSRISAVVKTIIKVTQIIYFGLILLIIFLDTQLCDLCLELIDGPA